MSSHGLEATPAIGTWAKAPPPIMIYSPCDLHGIFNIIHIFASCKSRTHLVLQLIRWHLARDDLPQEIGTSISQYYSHTGDILPDYLVLLLGERIPIADRGRLSFQPGQ